MPNPSTSSPVEESQTLPARRAASERTCIVTRQAEPPEGLIRFVLAPDGTVVPDLRRRLPGRGAWVTATAGHVGLAERRKLFARAFGAPATVEPGLAGRVDALLAEAAFGALTLARKAGNVIAGFGKVETALAREPVVALIHAAEARPDGVEKLAKAARRRFGEAPGPVVVRLFTGDQLDLAFGRPNVVHAAMLAGPASENLLARVRTLDRFRGGESGLDAADGLLTGTRDVSAEPESA